ncbi:MAG: hypothetical protein ABI262_05830 [Microcoleus sp.]
MELRREPICQHRPRVCAVRYSTRTGNRNHGTETKGEDTAPATPASNEFLSEVELNTLSIQLIRKLASAKKVRASAHEPAIVANLAGRHYRS